MRVSLIFNRKGKPNKDGSALIQLRAYQNGQSKYFSTNIYILPRQFKNNRVVDHPNARELNLKLKNLISDIEAFVLQQERTGQPVTFISIEKFFSYKDLNCFHEFCEKELIDDNSLKPSTKKHHKMTLGYLKDKFPKLSFSDLNYTTIHSFNNFLLGKALAPNTVHAHHKRLKRYIHLAIKKELFEDARNPYKHFKAKTAETQREVLTLDEISRLELMEIPPSKLSLAIVRDMFLMGCYTGLRFSDLIKIKRIDVHRNFDQVILKIKAQKTGKSIDLPLHLLHDGKPAQLLLKYIDRDIRKQELFTGITNQYANRCLKEISAQLGTDKKITMHVARHTFATHLALKVKPSLLQQLLQHSKIETTMIYVHLSEQMMLEELKKVRW